MEGGAVILQHGTVISVAKFDGTAYSRHSFYSIDLNIMISYN